jgi:hypothetical protein
MGGVMKKLLCLVLLTVLSTMGVQAQENDFYEIVDVKITEVPIHQKGLVDYNAVYANPDEIIRVTREFIALGKEIYAIIEAGRPVYNNNVGTPLQILPRTKSGETIQAMELENWKAPKSKKYKIDFKNGFGMNVVSFEFMLIYTYGGTYQGKGAYITGAQVSPTNVSVAWGFNVDANFKVQSIMNQGSLDNPVAGAVLQLNYRVSTVIKTIDRHATFHINGKGQTTVH